MVIAYSLYNITIQKNILCLQRNQRSSNTAEAILVFLGLLRVTKQSFANGNGVTLRNPGSGWRTDINPIE